MPRPVLAHHLILTAYGSWLPNDPRGSRSDFVRSRELYHAGGPATKVTARRSHAKDHHNHVLRDKGKSALQRPPVVFDGQQARVLMRGVADYLTANAVTAHAAAVMPDHVHLVLGPSDKAIETIATQIKARATSFLNAAGLHPCAPLRRDGRRPTPWANGYWNIFLFDQRRVETAVHYVEQNPLRAGHRAQRYSWVAPFDAQR